jgi:hypothetical protein
MTAPWREVVSSSAFNSDSHRGGEAPVPEACRFVFGAGHTVALNFPAADMMPKDMDVILSSGKCLHNRPNVG